MKYAIIDIGSNTVRIVIYKVMSKSYTWIANEKQFVQLIKYIKNGMICEEGIRRLRDALVYLLRFASQYAPDKFLCFATEPFRALDDSDKIIKILSETTNLRVDVLSGDEEARLSLTGARHSKKVNDGLFVDLGGGSLETSLLVRGKIEHLQSMSIGSVSLSDKFVTGILPTNHEIWLLKTHIDRQISQIDWLEQAYGHDMYCIGGTARSLCRLYKSISGRSGALDSIVINPGDIRDVFRSITSLNVDGPRLLARSCPDRMHTFVPGAIVLWRLAKSAHVRNIHFSVCGVREGYLLERVIGEAGALSMSDDDYRRSWIYSRLNSVAAV